MAIQNKAEIKAYYETHDTKAKEVAKIFNIAYRTLANWIAKEGWERGAAIKEIEAEVLNDNLTNHRLSTFLGSKKQELKKQIAGNIDVNELDSMIVNNLLESSTDELLLKAMNLNFINKNILLSAMIAKDELLRLVAFNKGGKPDPMIIACAEKTARMFEGLKVSLYGKEVLREAEGVENDYSKLSTNELLALLEKE